MSDWCGNKKPQFRDDDMRRLGWLFRAFRHGVFFEYYEKRIDCFSTKYETRCMSIKHKRARVCRFWKIAWNH